MRITIDTDDKGKVNIDTGDKGDDKPGLFESTSDIPVTDAGGAPIQEIERLSSMMATEGGTLSASPSFQEREAQLPLNPLRAGAAAAYQHPENLIRKAGAPSEQSYAAQDPSLTTIDGGSAELAKDKESQGGPTPE